MTLRILTQQYDTIYLLLKIYLWDVHKLGYIRKKFKIINNIKAYKFLINEFNLSMNEAQRWIDKKRVYLDGRVLKIKNLDIKGNVEVIFFKPESSKLKPIFETDYFAVFDKPSGVLVHPNKLSSQYSLNDDIKSLFGSEANVVHRIDKETSGLIMVSKYKKYEAELKKLFEYREVQKEYIALVEGKLDKEFTIEAKLKVNLQTSLIKIKSHICDDGKNALTRIIPLKYLPPKDLTIIRVIPMTGRTHQIRVHMFHVKHKIVGDPIYGINEFFVDKFLNGNMGKSERLKLAGAKRLMLHANRLSFRYKDKTYDIKSKINFEEICDEYCRCK